MCVACGASDKSATVAYLSPTLTYMFSATKRHLLGFNGQLSRSAAGCCRIASIVAAWVWLTNLHLFDVKVVPHWAELRTRLGICRAVAQLNAFLYSWHAP
jgi:hypothetical protein